MPKNPQYINLLFEIPIANENLGFKVIISLRNLKLDYVNIEEDRKRAKLGNTLKHLQ